MFERNELLEYLVLMMVDEQVKKFDVVSFVVIVMDKAYELANVSVVWQLYVNSMVVEKWFVF